MSEYSLIINTELTMVPTRQERKEKISADRRQQILNAALDVFTREGFASARTAEIARAAGVAEGTIYNYFKSKRELFVTVIRNYIITIPLLELIEKMPQGETDVVFKHILQNRLDLIQNMSTFQIPALMAEIQHDPELQVLWREQFIRPFLSRMEAGYRFMETSGKFRRMEPAIAVRTVGGMILGFLILKLMEGEASPLNKLHREKVIDEIANLILYGLLNTSQEERK